MTRRPSFLAAAAVTLLAVFVVRAQEAAVPGELTAPPYVPRAVATQLLPGVAPPATAAVPLAAAPAAPPAAGGMTLYNYKKLVAAGFHGVEDPQLTELLQSDRALSEQISALAASLKDLSDGDKRNEAERQLGELVTKQFEVRQSLRERQLAALEAQVKRLRTIHDERNSQKDRIIADRVQQLVRESQGLGWGELSDDFGQRGPRRVTFSTSSAGAPIDIGFPLEERTLQWSTPPEENPPAQAK